MAEAFFESYNTEITDGNQVLLIGGFSDLVHHGWSWREFYTFVGDQVVWTSPDCRVTQSDQPLPGHDYSVDVHFTSASSTKPQTLHITSVNAAATASTLVGFVQLCSEAQEEECQQQLTFQCFATTPRQSLGTLHSDDITRWIRGSKLSKLGFQFVSLDEETTKTVMTCGVPEIEWKQCIVEGLEQVLSLNGGPRIWVVSYTMPEFSKFGMGLYNNSVVQKLDLLLHFWLQGSTLETFAKSLAGNVGLKSLKIFYLDVNDEGWSMICEALRHHPSLTHVEMGFTEKFVDNFRRLTPERRSARTKAVLDLLQANHVIQEFIWPDFQHDETLMEEISACLRRNRTASK